MASTSRRWIGGVAIVLGFLALIVLALPYVVSLDAVRARVISAAESRLQRKVDIGRMRLRIFSGLGVSVQKLVVHDKQGTDAPALVSADEVSVEVAFRPLLSRRVEVRKIVFDGVTVTIARGPDGKLNVDDFLSASQRESQPASQAVAAALVVSRIEIDRGRVVFADRKVSPGKTVTTALEDLTGRIHDIGPTTPARFELAGRFLADSGRNLKLAGTLGPPPAERPVGESPLRATFAARNLALRRLAPYVRAFAANDPGVFSIDGLAEGALVGALKLSGNLGLVPAAATSPIPKTDGTYSIALDWPKGTLAITRSRFSIANLPLHVHGRVENLHRTPRFSLQIGTPGNVTVDDVTGLPGFAGKLPARVKLSGRLKLEAKVRGSSSRLAVRASLDAAPFAVHIEGQPVFAVPSVDGTVESHGGGALAGRITAPKGMLKSLPFEDLAANWSWNHGVLTLRPRARVLGGELGAGVVVDLARPDSESRLEIDFDGLRGERLPGSHTSVRNAFSGALTGRMSVTSKGLSWNAVSKTARGEGRVALEDADLRTPQLRPEVMRALSAVGRVAGFQVSENLESTRFDDLRTSLRLADGRVVTPDLRLSGRDVTILADGWVGFDRTLSYQGRIILGPTVVRSFGRVGEYMADAQGQLVLPFRVSGQIGAPEVTIDKRLVLDLGRRAVARLAQEKLRGRVGRILGDAMDRGGGRRERLVNLLQQFLRPSTPGPPATPRR